MLSAQGLHQRWGELQRAPGGGASREEAEWTTNELRNSLRSIEWDLEDLDETIDIHTHTHTHKHTHMVDGEVVNGMVVMVKR